MGGGRDRGEERERNVSEMEKTLHILKCFGVCVCVSVQFIYSMTVVLFSMCMSVCLYMYDGISLSPSHAGLLAFVTT